jgi:hypothetical protein
MLSEPVIRIAEFQSTEGYGRHVVCLGVFADYSGYLGSTE